MNTTELQRLIKIISALRGPNGCPWDKDQDFRSMRPYLLEEVYEVLDAIDGNDHKSIHEELGDLLFVVLLLCQIGVDNQSFTLDSLCQRIADKMVFRHPHVFENPNNQITVTDSLTVWENEKAKRNPNRSRLDGVPRSLPALLRAFRQGEKAAATGFDWPDYHGVLNKVEEELQELREAIQSGEQSAINHELGDVLLSLSSLGRHLNATPEEALREANDRFADRFKLMERLAKEREFTLQDSTDAVLEALWEEAKKTLS